MGISFAESLKRAQYDLGICYYYGQGVPENKKEALRLWKLAAVQEYEKAVEALREFSE